MKRRLSNQISDLKAEELRLHSKTSGYKDRKQEAKDWLRGCSDFYVSYSGGKDSTALLFLTAEVYDSFPVFHFDWGVRNIPGIEQYCYETATEVVDDENYYSRTSQDVQSLKLFAEDVHRGIQGLLGQEKRLRERHGWKTCLLGIRGEESTKRRRDYTGSPPSKHLGGRCVAPLHRWSTKDVWAYLFEKDIDVHELYFKQADLFDGIESPENRLCTLYDHQFSSLGSEDVSEHLYPGRVSFLKKKEQEL